MSNQSNRQNRGQQRPRSLREESEASSELSDRFVLRKGVRDFAVVVLVLNVLNVLLYNTGWLSWRADSFDIIWATSVCVLDIAVIVMFQLLDR